MPKKHLSDPNSGTYTFGGGKETVYTETVDPNGYTIYSKGGDDTIFGSGNDDALYGGIGGDVIFGGGGNDTIYAADGADAIDYRHGHDPSNTNTLYGDGVPDANGMYLGGYIQDGGTYTGGDDLLYGGNGPYNGNNFYGEIGVITLQNSAIFTGGNDTLHGGTGFDNTNSLRGDVAIARVAAGSVFNGGDDVLYAGSDGSQYLIGDAGNVEDSAGTINGGDDTLYGGASGDALTGDWGLVTNSSGATFNGGLDTFAFLAAGGTDRITDFEAGKDTLDLSNFSSITLAELNNAGGDNLLTGADQYVTVTHNDFTGQDSLVLDLGAAMGDGTSWTITFQNTSSINIDDINFTA